ncbi:hypothetical protein TNCV_2648741 [Trichonephila clavipes]|nr:hypothetical protein TNCV_2648741 [Trichonephila clavipes]
MFLDFAPDLPNESINFAFVWRVSGVIPEFSESIFSSDKLSDVSGRWRCGVFISLVEVEAEIAFEILVNIQCRRNGSIAQNITVCVCPAWVPARMLGIKITKKKGFVTMVENCVEFRSINGAVWRSINTRHSNLTVLTYPNDDR